MTKTAETLDLYLADAEAAESRQPLSWLTPLRKAALACFAELGFPTVREEEWRYTNLARLAQTPFVAGPAWPEVRLEDLRTHLWRDAAGQRLVFLNGRYAPHLSDLDPLPPGVIVGSLAAALGGHADELEAHLARHARFQEQPLVALNTAFLHDGACVRIGRGVVVERPIHIIFVAAAGPEPTYAQPRTLILAGEGSEATVVESYVRVGTAASFTNAVTEVVAAESAIVDHCKLQHEGAAGYHLATLQVQQARNSSVNSHCLSLGAGLARHDINVVLEGEGGHCTLNGLYVAGGEQHVDNHLRVEHVAPHCESREVFKGILDERARGVFTGRIIVHKGAQKTDGKQSNMNLLLSSEAQVDTKPQLEIFADDVKCTHGATIGQLDEDAVFYLRSRGLSAAAARSLLVHAFASESLDRIRVPGLRLQVRNEVLSRLPHGELFRELA